MNSLPPTISILFERQPAPTLRQRLRDHSTQLELW